MIEKNERRRYASDLSDSQCAIIEPLFPRAGNRIKWEKRELADAVLYFVDNGCKWRNLPHDFPPYTTVASFYYAAIRSGLWEKICAALVERVRIDAGQSACPSYAIIGSQSVKTTSAAEERGIDGGKTKGRKRHIVVDTMGNLLAAGGWWQFILPIYMIRSQVFWQQELPSRNIHLFNSSAPMQDTAKPLSRMFPRNWGLALTFQRA